MKLLNMLLALSLIVLLYNNLEAKTKETAVACRVTSIDETVIQYLKKRIGPF